MGNDIAPGDFCVVTRDIVLVDGQVAFSRGEQVVVEKDELNSASPRHRYVVLSARTENRYQLSGADLIKVQEHGPPPSTPGPAPLDARPAGARQLAPPVSQAPATEVPPAGSRAESLLARMPSAKWFIAATLGVVALGLLVWLLIVPLACDMLARSQARNWVSGSKAAVKSATAEVEPVVGTNSKVDPGTNPKDVANIASSEIESVQKARVLISKQAASSDALVLKRLDKGLEKEVQKYESALSVYSRGLDGFVEFLSHCVLAEDAAGKLAKLSEEYRAQVHRADRALLFMNLYGSYERYLKNEPPSERKTLFCEPSLRQSYEDARKAFPSPALTAVDGAIKTLEMLNEPSEEVVYSLNRYVRSLGFLGSNDEALNMYMGIPSTANLSWSDAYMKYRDEAIGAYQQAVKSSQEALPGLGALLETL